MRQSSLFPDQPAMLVMMAGAILLAGCATTATPPTPAAGEPVTDLHAAALKSTMPVVRYGRYTLVELVAQPAQRDLMRQVVEVTIPPTLDANVGDALRHVLQRSGYRLCDTPDAAALYALALPAAHLRLGPLMLHDALLTLAGPAWDLSVDEGVRLVCFSRHVVSAPVSAKPTAAANTERAEDTGGREIRP